MMNESNNKQILNRDLQILIGKQIVSGKDGGYVSEGIFKLLMASPIIRSSALDALGKLTVFTLNECRARIASADDKKYICIDFRSLTGYVYLRHLVTMVMNHVQSKPGNISGRFFTELYLLDLKGMDVSQLLNIFLMLKDLTIINLPYAFDTFSRNSATTKLEKLIHRNAKSLQSLHHVMFPFTLIPQIHDRVVAINYSTLRTGSLDKEGDFFAFYMDPFRCPPCLPLPNDGGIVMRICVHRCKQLFRAIKGALQKYKLRSQITALSLCSVYDFDIKSAQTLLDQVARIRIILPKLSSLTLELRTLECYPESLHYAPHGDELDDEMDMVPSCASICSNVATFVLDYFREQSFDFNVDARFQLAVDYQYGKEADDELLEKTMSETISRTLGAYWADLMKDSVTVQNGSASANAKVRVNDKTNFSFGIEFRSITIVVDPGYYERNLFRITHSL